MADGRQSGPPCQTPVIFLIWNRPEVTARVWQAIAAARPPKLFVVADGPRPDRADDPERCARTRALIDDVDWDCQVHRNFAETNLGLKNRVSSGITWAFEQVEQAIILEDDCLPDPSFFAYCTQLLERYADDERVMQVAGTNLNPDFPVPGEASYFFSNYSQIWGWATWRRAWQHFDADMLTWPAFRDAGMIDWLPFPPRLRRHLAAQFDRVHGGHLDSWGYGWAYAMYRQGGLCVLPRPNLVSNLGFDEEATHTKDSGDPLADLGRGNLDFPLRHPGHRLACRPWDNALEGRLQRSLAERAWRKAGRLWRRYTSH